MMSFFRSKALPRILSLFAAFELIANSKVDAHSTQIRECLTAEGNLRIFVRHWHGALSTASSAGTMKIRDDTGGVTGTVQTLYAQDVVNNVAVASVGCIGGTTSTLASDCSGENQDDWVYYDFPTQVRSKRS